VRAADLRVGRRITEPVAEQLRGFENRFALPALQRIDPEDSRSRRLWISHVDLKSQIRIAD
jgi:hypothetical protein